MDRKFRLLPLVGVAAVLSVACTSAQPTASNPPSQLSEPSQPSQPAKPADPAKPAAPTEPRVERLVMAVRGPAVEGNNPNFEYGGPDAFQLRPMYEYMVGVDPKTGKYVPQIASQWSVEPDGKGFRLQIQKGIKYHGGGGNVVAADMVHAYTDLSDEGSLHGSAQEWRRDIESVTAVNDQEVLFRLKRANPNVFNVVSEQVGGVEVMSKADFDARGGRPNVTEAPLAGTGPYQFKERRQGEFVRFERLPGKHWRTQVDFKEFELRFVTEVSTRLAGLLAGEVHITDLPTDLQKQATDRGMKVLNGQSAGLRTFFGFLGAYYTKNDPELGYQHPDNPLLNKKVRQALSKAIDRSALNKAFFGGQAEIMHINTLHPTRLGWDPSFVATFKRDFDYDPEGAKKLLAEAGYTKDTPLKTAVFAENLPTYAGSADLVEAAADFWSKVGVDVELLTTDRATIAAKTRAREYDNHIRILGTSSDIYIGTRVYHGGGGATPYYIDADLMRLYQEATSTLDLKKQDNTFREMGQRIQAEHQDVPLFWLPITAVVNPKVVGSWAWPGSITGTWTHYENIRSAK